MDAFTELTRADEPNLVYECVPGNTPYVVFLPGFKSVMASAKGHHLRTLAIARGLGFVRFDYRGHGQSGGQLRDGCLDDWVVDATACIEASGATQHLLVGASMGAWVGLVLARSGVPTVGLVSIGGAFDVGGRMIASLPLAERDRLRRDGIGFRPSRYGDGLYPVTRRMIESAWRNRVLDGDWTLNCPMHIVHGMNDPDVHYSHALDAAKRLDALEITITLVKGGDHRLSDDKGLVAIEQAVSRLLERNVD